MANNVHLTPISFLYTASVVIQGTYNREKTKNEKALIGLKHIADAGFKIDWDKLFVLELMLTRFIIAIVDTIISLAIIPQIKTQTTPLDANPSGLKIGKRKFPIQFKILFS